MKKMIATVAAALVLAAGIPAYAQQDEAPRKEQRERMKDLRHKVLVNKVGLSEEKATKVEGIIDGFNTERAPIRKQMAEEKQALKQLLKQNSDDQGSYEGAIKRLREAQKKLAGVREKEFGALQKELTPKEQAKMLRALHKFRNQQKAMKGKGRGNGKGPRGKHQERNDDE